MAYYIHIYLRWQTYKWRQHWRQAWRQNAIRNREFSPSNGSSWYIFVSSSRTTTFQSWFIFRAIATASVAAESRATELKRRNALRIKSKSSGPRTSPKLNPEAPKFVRLPQSTPSSPMKATAELFTPAASLSLPSPSAATRLLSSVKTAVDNNNSKVDAPHLRPIFVGKSDLDIKPLYC